MGRSLRASAAKHCRWLVACITGSCKGRERAFQRGAFWDMPVASGLAISCLMRAIRRLSDRELATIWRVQLLD